MGDERETSKFSQYGGHTSFRKANTPSHRLSSSRGRGKQLCLTFEKAFFGASHQDVGLAVLWAHDAGTRVNLLLVSGASLRNPPLDPIDLCFSEKILKNFAQCARSDSFFVNTHSVGSLSALKDTQALHSC